jgi:hypothetical protein
METYWVLELLQEPFDQSQPNSPGRAIRPAEPCQTPPPSSDWSIRALDFPTPYSDPAGPPPLGAWGRSDHPPPPPGSGSPLRCSRRSATGAPAGPEWGRMAGSQGSLSSATTPARWFAGLAPAPREPDLVSITTRRHSVQDYVPASTDDRRRNEPRRRSLAPPPPVVDSPGPGPFALL